MLLFNIRARHGRKAGDLYACRHGVHFLRIYISERNLTPSLKSEAEYLSCQSCSWENPIFSSMQQTMISMFVIPIVFFVARCSAFLLPPSLSLTTHPIPLTNSSSEISSTNGSIFSLNETRLKCHPSYYGRDLDMKSCESALDKMPRSRAAMTYVSRTYTTPIAGAIRLPLRYLSDDGACAIDVDQKRRTFGAISDFTTPNTLADRAADILKDCVHSKQWGGNVSGFCMCKFFHLALGGFLVGVDHRGQQFDNRFC